MAPEPRKNRSKADINITPLIDIVLVLLIIFIVLVPTLSKSLSVAIPIRSEQPRPAEETVPVVVSLGAEGRILLQQEPVALGELWQKLVPVVLLQPLGLRKVFLKVDGELPHEQAVRVLDQIRVASDRARLETLARLGSDPEGGGDIKVAVALLKPASPGAAVPE